jgi:predicted DNA-binding transcriptional regulator YafY
MKTQRLLLELFFLMRRKAATAGELAEFIGVSRRTVFRDKLESMIAGMEVLKQFGSMELAGDAGSLLKRLTGLAGGKAPAMSTMGYVEPYGLINKVGYWYLAGYCHETGRTQSRSTARAAC